MHRATDTADVCKRKLDLRPIDAFLALENPVLLVDRSEQVFVGGDIFRGSMKEKAAGTQRVMKEREDLLLALASERSAAVGRSRPYI